MDYEILTACGVDYKQGIRRCMDDADVYYQMLVAFLEDDSFRRAKEAHERRNYKDLFSCLHELKGACGNADFTVLYAAVSPLVELLRRDDRDSAPEAEVDALFQKIEAAYERTRDGVSLALGM